MKTILVTGGNSQLAQSIKSISTAYTKLSFIFKSREELDITDSESLQKFIANYKFDFCINCAAYTEVDRAENDLIKANKINCLAVENLAVLCKKNKILLIHISTDFVFDGTNKTPYTENNTPNPINIYGKSKICGENALSNNSQEYFIIRTSWLYSEFGNNFLKTMLRLSENKKEVNVVEDQIGCPTYAKDLAKVIIELINSNNSEYGTYHYSNRGSISWHEFAEAIFQMAESKTKANKIRSKDYPTKARRPDYSVLSTNKIRKMLNIEIPHWKESLKSAMNILRKNKNLQLAIEASLAAGNAIMDVYDSEITIEYKDDQSPLTEADKKANSIINSIIKPTGIPIISEENKQKDYAERKEWDECWIVDPLDGTKEFIKRNGEFTVNIALIEGGVPKLGVIYVPASKELYYADVDSKKAFKTKVNSFNFSIEDIMEKSTRIEPSSNDSNAIEIVGSRSHMNQETLDFVNSLKLKGNKIQIVSKGSSLKFCLLAEGKADIYPRFAPTMEWDTAAGQAICSAVGVEVISKVTEKPLRYNKEDLLNPWFIVSKL